MKIKDIIAETLKLDTDRSRARAWIKKVYELYPQTWQHNHVMMWGEGEAQQIAMFELVPNPAKKDTVEVQWFSAYPQRQGVGARAMAELQRLAREDGINLSLYAWGRGKITQPKLMRFYKKQGFTSKNKSPVMSWSPEIKEGGWDTAKTQSTVISPAVVRATLAQMQKFTNDFNQYLESNNLPQVRMGRPTGSSAYHAVDTDDKIYGDIDLQMIAPEVEGLSYGQFTAHWNQLADEFVHAGHAPYVDTSESKPGHPIVALGNEQYVQVDFMWHPERLERWGAARVTPEHGVKGLLYGNMYSVFGELLDMSIQHAGVQLKVIDGEHVPFSKQKGTETITVTTEPTTFIRDVFKYIANQQGIKSPKIAHRLKQFPGNDIEDVKISKLAEGIKGFAESCEINHMFGRGDLQQFADAQDFLNKFVQRYEEKAMLDVTAKKRDKATTPEAQARAEADRQKVLQGLTKVKGYFK